MVRPTAGFQALAQQWRPHIQILLVLCFVTFASALSDDSSAISAGNPENAGFINGTAFGQDLHYFYKRAKINSRSNVVYTSTCSDNQVTYLSSSLNEAKDLASRAFTAVSELVDIMQHKEQPEHWPSASYTRRYRNLRLWGSLFGEPILERGVGKRTLADTINAMKIVKNAFRRARNALDAKKNQLHMIISCGDDWLVYSHEEEIKDDEGAKVLSRDFPQKDWLGFMSTHPVDSPLFQSNDTNSYRSTGMYRDTRVQDRDAYMSHEKACHEAPNMRGYTWKNKITNKEETVYCPSSFLLWDGRHIADRQSSTFESMKGKTFKDVKEYAAAGTVLHETTHSEEVMGEYYSTEDVRITYQGKVYAAYGGPLCRELAMTFSEEIGYPEKNADTLALFALGVYYSQCNWANPNKPSRCWTDTPDNICPTVNNERRCVTFDWNA